MKRDLTLEEVLELRQQIVLNSLFVSDYRNNMGVDPRAACDFFDGFMCYCCAANYLQLLKSDYPQLNKEKSVGLFKI